LEELEVDRRIILKIVLNEYSKSFWTRLIWLRTRRIAGCRKESNEISRF